MAQTGRSSAPPSSSMFSLSQRADGSRAAQYSFSKAVLVSQTGGCRVLSYCEPLSCLLASQPSPHSTLVPGNLHSYFHLVLPGVNFTELVLLRLLLLAFYFSRIFVILNRLIRYFLSAAVPV